MVNKTAKSKIVLLNILRESDTPLSGEKLGKMVNKSRVSVWKQIESLQERGYTIERSRNGYKLIKEPNDAIYGWNFDQNLNLSYFNKTDSTMNRANSKCKKNAEDSIVIAETQSNGRSRSETNWTSDNGGLFLSFATQKRIPSILTEKLVWIITSEIAKKLSIVIKEAVYPVWPNEILYQKKKLGGVLLESEISGGVSTITTIGVGINIKNKIDSLSSATSLSQISTKEITRKNIAEMIIDIINQSLKMMNRILNSKSANTIVSEAIIKLWFDKTIECKCTGIVDVLGRIEVKQTDGEINFFSSGEIQNIKYGNSEEN